MRVLLDLCVYCERTPTEIVEAGDAETDEDALAYAKIGENQVLLCPKCTDEYVPEPEIGLEELKKAPVSFPPGVTAVEHSCPALDEDGEAPQWSTFVLQMTRNGDYYSATCPHCGITVRSLAEDEL